MNDHYIVIIDTRNAPLSHDEMLDYLIEKTRQFMRSHTDFGGNMDAAKDAIIHESAASFAEMAIVNAMHNAHPDPALKIAADLSSLLSRAVYQLAEQRDAMDAAE